MKRDDAIGMKVSLQWSEQFFKCLTLVQGLARAPQTVLKPCSPRNVDFLIFELRGGSYILCNLNIF